MHNTLLIYFVIFIALLIQSSAFWWRRRDRRRCNTNACQWSWASCSQTCGGGTQIPIITRHKGSCGPTCNLPSAKSCSTNCCPINCLWGSWGNWGLCSRSCGRGTSVRIRNHSPPRYCGGSLCTGSSTESRSCEIRCCPINCVWGPWNNLGLCSVSCGGGILARNRNISVNALCGGSTCIGSSTDSITCSTHCCPVDCEWDNWGEYSSCSQSCGSGIKSRTRSIRIEEACGGSPCFGSNQDQVSCNTMCCPGDCVWDAWSSYGPCSVTCEGGIRQQTRSYSTESSCEYNPCPGKASYIANCSTVPCPIHCQWGPWSNWERCSASCDGGTQSRNRSVITFAQHMGMECSGDGNEERNCNEECCPVDCVWEEWSLWNSCSASCGGGIQTRKRYIAMENQCGGFECHGNSSEIRMCNNICCPVNCSLSDWSEWDSCNVTCGIGTQSRSRVVERAELCGGRTCVGGLMESRKCNTQCFSENLCSYLNCSSNAICILNENRTSSCKCNSGFRGDPYRLCQPYCASERLEINQVSFSFPDTWDKQFAYSIETCHNTTRPIASVFCKNSKFEVFDAVVVPCNISPTSIKLDDSLKNLNETELQNLTNVLRLVTYSEDRTLNETQSDFLVSVLNTALTNDVKVNPSSFSNAMVILSDVLYNTNNSDETNLPAVELVEEFASRVVLPNGTNSIEIETNELVAKVYKVDLQSANDPGIRETQSVSDNVILRDAQTNNTEIAVEFDLPISAFTEGSDGNSEAHNNQQFFTTYYKASSLFPSKSYVTSVFSINLASNVSTTHLQTPLKIRFSNQDYKIEKKQLPSNHLLAEQTKLECRFWNFSTNQWSREGCWLNQSQFPPVCQSNHLTNFALLVAIDTVPNDVILNYISDVGCVLSIIGLTITIIIHLLIAERRRIQTTKVFLNVCINLMVAYIIFVSGISQASNKRLCSAITVLLHYFFLTSWFWMTAYCFDLYLNLIKVIHTISSSAVMKGSYIFGYLLPMIIVGLTSIITLGHLDKSDSGLICDGDDLICDGENMLATSFYRADNMCWLHGYSLYIGFLLPVGILLIINMSIYAFVLTKVICKTRKIGNVSLKMSQRRILTISLTLFSTMGISWIVGFFMLVSTDPGSSLALSWVFAIVTASQGLLIFVTSCILQKNVRNETRKWTESFRNVIGRKSQNNSTSMQITSSKTAVKKISPKSINSNS